MAALCTALAPTPAERAAALRLAASLCMAGVAGREIARALGVAETELSRMLTPYPEACVTRASDVVFDEHTQRWTAPDAAPTV
ncbi:hypothetical protein [Corynebacterium timonense]|uniref:Uncharacterized protein n=1 Tax=Corynebacterium timonense TaxID=441500 RepID=A0A1H1PNG0_9CORY|nr:hypothetical protein [Corynebacterium timonense]SDS12635.1 hypothetical protein SAMN04488539_1058 [Corynebacterium timonense]